MVDRRLRRELKDAGVYDVGPPTEGPSGFTEPVTFEQEATFENGAQFTNGLTSQGGIVLDGEQIAFEGPRFWMTTGSLRLSESVEIPSTNQVDDLIPGTESVIKAWNLSDAGEDVTLTGMANGLGDGNVVVFVNVDASFNLVVAHESASSTAANRFALPGGVDRTLAPGESVMLVYLASRWRVLG